MKTFRPLIYIFVGFFLLASFGLWLDKKMGWEHERALKNQGTTKC